jgi:hypothetical protein
LQVAFKSEYLQLFQSQQVTASELLVTKEALAEAKLVRGHITSRRLVGLTVIVYPIVQEIHGDADPVDCVCGRHEQDSYNTEKALAWLTAAHAEERALRVAIKAQMVELQVSGVILIGRAD